MLLKQSPHCSLVDALSQTTLPEKVQLSTTLGPMTSQAETRSEWKVSSLAIDTGPYPASAEECKSAHVSFLRVPGLKQAKQVSVPTGFYPTRRLFVRVAVDHVPCRHCHTGTLKPTGECWDHYQSTQKLT